VTIIVGNLRDKVTMENQSMSVGRQMLKGCRKLPKPVDIKRL
jgi:hypothetical protein